MQNLFYFVDNISISFVKNDIKKLSDRYDKVFLFSVNILSDKEDLPKNVLTFENYIDWKKFNSIEILVRNFFPIFYIYLFESWKLKKVLPFIPSIKLLVSNIFKANQIMEVINQNTDLKNAYKKSTFYSFWFYDCIYLACLRKKEGIKNVIARTHGGDLFEERGSLGKVLFRNFQFENIDKILSVSKKGEEYLVTKYSDFKSKILTSYLGSRNKNDLSNQLDVTSDTFVLVSCARVRNIKRIHLIAETLTHLDFKIKWFHIGDENLSNKKDHTISIYVKNKEYLKEKQNIQFVNFGHLDNKEVLKFYEKQSVNLFISLSETEGIPVSMMEAISFGIPILSTDVGGCNEIVNDKTGVLIPLETKAEDVAKIIEGFKNSNKNTAEFRKGVKQFWEENFNEDKNYQEFFKYLEV